VAVRALIPSGGAGTRLRPITHTNAKQLVPIANVPILSYVLDDVAEAGIADAVIVVGETEDEIRAYVGDGSAWGLRASFIRQDEPRGLAHTVLIAREALGDDPFVMYLGDNMLRDGIASLVRAYEAEPVAAQILTVRVADPRAYGVVEMDGERVARLVEKPESPASDLALAGVYVFDARVHEAVRALAPSARGELEITEAIQWLVDSGAPVRAHRVDGWWKDTGHVEDLLEANRLVLAGETAIDPTARVTDSKIGANTAIGPGCVVRNAEIENSIVMEGCMIDGARLRDSLLGRNVSVTGSSGARARLVIGDNGNVVLD
jgi:glucose-1-phosphate thymidylyltransferase